MQIVGEFTKEVIIAIQGLSEEKYKTRQNYDGLSTRAPKADSFKDFRHSLR